MSTKRAPAKRPALKKRTKSASLSTRKPLSSHEERFVRDVVTRGEAAEADASGGLPPGATHVVVKPGTAKDLPVIRRQRFSAF